MKKNVFLLKVLVFFALYVFISILISFFIPYHWGNPWYSSKIKYLENSEDNNYNTFFFGSSRVYRQINPSVFDRVANLSNDDTIRSFNLGAPATFCPQTYYLYEEFLKTDVSDKAKYCFIELMGVDYISDNMMHQERTTYWQTYTVIEFVFKYSFFPNGSFKFDYSRAKMFLRYVLSYIENTLHIGHFGQQILDNNYYNTRYIGNSNNGFYSLESDLKDSNDEFLIKRRIKFLSDSSQLELRKSIIKSDYSERSTSRLDNVAAKKLNELICISKNKGVKLFFILSPRYRSVESLSLLNSIPSEHLIDMCNPATNIDYYMFEKSFDVGHLNDIGADIYSANLATVFLSKVPYENRD